VRHRFSFLRVDLALVAQRLPKPSEEPDFHNHFLFPPICGGSIVAGARPPYARSGGC
jgi:hypothetical protein